MQSPKQVLIVEDNPDWQEVLVTILSEAGYECRVASDYASGLDILRRDPPLTLVLDLKLREHPGDEDFIGWRLAKQALEYNVPIVIVTGHPSASGARKAFRDYKVIDFFDKAILDRQELVRRVSEGVKVSRKQIVSPRAQQRALEELRKMFYSGRLVRPGRE